MVFRLLALYVMLRRSKHYRSIRCNELTSFVEKN